MELTIEKPVVYITFTQEQLDGYSNNLIQKTIEALSKEEKEFCLTPDEVLRKLKVTRTTLWRWEKKGYLIPKRIGARVFYKEGDIDKLLNE